jgi:catechol 2,3-dioxygenase-like lactoylglutathione lyase family enzyme
MTKTMATLTYACVLTRDIENLAKFYREVLNMDPQWNGAYAEFGTGPTSLCLWATDAYVEIAGPAYLPAAGTGRTMLEFQVDDVDAEYARLQQLSQVAVEFIIPPRTMEWGNRSIYFRDPDGNLVNLFSHVE